MNTLTIATVGETSLIQQRGNDIEVSAFEPQEMRNASVALIEWCANKIKQVQDEAEELRQAYTHAVQRKWKASTLLRHAELAAKRATFYEKIKLALEHGYYIVPNFPVTAFAIRTTAKTPTKGYTRDRYNRHAQEPRLLPAGEGEYKNPFPLVYAMDITSNADKAAGKTTVQYFAKEFDEMEFPVNMAKPAIMEATSRAMALKIFDSIGVLPDGRRNADPVIVGRLYNPASPCWLRVRSGVSFIIGWHLDTSTL